MSAGRTARPAAFGGARRIVVKIGSAVLSRAGRFDRVAFVTLVRDMAALRDAGVEVVVVSSGAVALGMERTGRTDRPREMAAVQATAAIGQGWLMRMWEDEWAAYGLHAAQILLTHDDLGDRRRFLQARHTLRAVLEMGAVPVVNENDTIATDEIRLGDNDELSAQIVGLSGADLLVILSDVDGLYDRSPSEPGARRFEHVPRIDEEIEAVAGGTGSTVGSGGMRTKLAAIKQVNHLGVPAIIAEGRAPSVLSRLHAGEPIGTWFAAPTGALASRKHWIAYSLRPRGTIRIDDGAARAITSNRRSLLPVGVVAVDGAFQIGDLVRVEAIDGREIARGLVSHPSEVIRDACGRRPATGPFLDSPEVIHRDDLVILPGRAQPPS
jgi:glutamate 5-kinase